MAMVSEADQPLLQPHEQQQEKEASFQKDTQEMGLDLRARIGQMFHDLNQLKSLEILQSALEILMSNKKHLLLMVFYTTPLFIFITFFEIKLQKAAYFTWKILANFSSDYYYQKKKNLDAYVYDDDDSIQKSDVLHLFLELCPLYFVVYPLMELFFSSIIIRSAANVYAGEKESSSIHIKDEFFSQIRKGSLSTSFWVHLLSTSTIVGLFWIVANHFLISRWSIWLDYGYYFYTSFSSAFVSSAFVSAGFHALVYVALLYKYLDWSAIWNMAMVISVLEEEIGMEALEMSGYYAKRCRRSGFQLMLGFFVFGAVLRLPCMIMFGKYNTSVVGVLVTSIVVGFVCLVNLVKWVSMVLYFYDCKAQTLQKKVDEEVGIAKGHAAC